MLIVVPLSVSLYRFVTGLVDEAYIPIFHCFMRRFWKSCALVQIVKETIPALLKLREQGLVRAIGITGLPLDIYTYILDRYHSTNRPKCNVLGSIEAIMRLQREYGTVTSWLLCRVPEGSVDAILSYCHNNLSDNTLVGLLPYLEKKGVAVISASFSSMGLLTQKVKCQEMSMCLHVLIFMTKCWTVRLRA